MKKNLIIALIAFLMLLMGQESVAQAPNLAADSIIFQCNQSGLARVPIRVRNFTNIGSFQFTLKWNPQSVTYKNVSPFGPQFSGLNNTFISFDTAASNISQGILTFSWVRFGGHTVSNDAEVFSVNFDYSGNGADSVQFISQPTSVEFADSAGTKIPFTTKNGFVGLIDNVKPTITCPANVTIANASGPSTTPNSIAPTAINDNCGIQKTGYSLAGVTSGSFPNSADASSQIFQSGLTTVTYTTTDKAGNTASCAFTVGIPIVDDTLTIFTQIGSTVDCGKPFFIDVKATNMDSLGSLQFSLDWKSAVLRFDSVGQINPAFSMSSFLDFNTLNTATQPNAQLGMSWASFVAKGVKLPVGTTLFRVYYTVVGSASANTALAFTDSPVVKEAYTNKTSPSSKITARYLNSMVLVTDNTPPTIVCPASITVQPDAASVNATVNTGINPSVADNCGLDNYSHGILYNGQTSTGMFNATGTYKPGTSTVTYKATDDAGNTATCSFTVTVAKITAAEFNIDSLILGCHFTDTAEVCIRVKNFEPVAGVQFAVRFDSTVLRYVGYSKVNTAIANGFFFVNKTASNEIRLVGSNSNGWPDLADGTSFICLRFIPLKKAASPVFIYDSPNYVFQVTNSNADKIAGTFSNGLVSTADTKAPLFSNCPMMDTLSFNAPNGFCSRDVSWMPIIATDDCGGLAGSTATHPAAGSTFQLGITPVVFTAVDSAGNTANCSFFVQVKDVTPPVFANCPTDLTVHVNNSCSTAGNWTTPTATDECSLVVGDPKTNIKPDSLLGIGAHNVLYTAYDSSGNGHTCAFKVTVRDTIAPILTACPKDTTVILSGTACKVAVSWPAPTVSDACLPANGGLSINTISGSEFIGGIYPITYTATDSAGNKKTCTFQLTVKDTIAPVLSPCPSNMTLYVTATNCTVKGNWAAPTLTDACLPMNGGLSSNIKPDSALVPGSFMVVYTGKDQGGNTVSCSFSVLVRDTIAPLFASCPPSQTSTNPTFTYNYAPPTATDNCGQPTITASHLSGFTFTNDTTVVIIATDASGNKDSCTFTIDVLNCSGMTPQVTCPSNMAIQGVCDTALVFLPPAISGFCSTDTTFIVGPFGNGMPLSVGDYTIRYEVNTPLGEQAMCTFQVTIDETTKPVINCPTAVLVDVAGNVLSDLSGFITSATPDANCTKVVLTYKTPTAMDNCSGATAVTASGPASGSSFAIGASMVTFNAKDAANNNALPCEVKVTVQNLPNITIASNGLEVCPGGTARLIAATIPNATYTWSGPGGNFANNDTIVISPFGTANIGAYDLEVTINGCMLLAANPISLTSILMPDAQNDLISVVENEALSSINVLSNDLNVPTSYTVTMLSPANGVTQVNEGIFSFAGTDTPGDIYYSYLLCSKVCPTLCDTGFVAISIKNTRCDFLPNVISPNNDGINDEFLIPCLEFGDYPNNSLVIYSQWGDKVFEAAPYKWDKVSAFKGLKDGRQGDLLPDGVYYYIFRTSSSDAPYKGFIQLHR